MSRLYLQNSSLVPSLAPYPTSLDGTGSTITNIVFGILALVVGIITIWQAYHIYHVWHPTTIGTIRPEYSSIRLTGLMTVLDVNFGPSSVESEIGAERHNGDSISLQPGTSQKRQTSNGGGSEVSVGLPPQHTAELPEVD